MIPIFNYYASDIENSRPLGTVMLSEFFDAIKNPKPHIKEIFEQIHRAELEGNKQLKAELKVKLFSFTPCVLIEGRRRYADIVNFTGLMMLDFDHIDNAEEFKLFLFNEYDFIIATWLSASKRGVRALVNIPYVNTVNEFKALFMGLTYEHMMQYDGFDTAPKNPVLPLFLSYDPDIVMGDTKAIWTGEYHELKPDPIKQYKFEQNPTRVQKIITTIIDKIHDNGHPQLRAASFVLGGYVGGGAIDKSEAIELIDYLIIHNQYLSIKPDVYKKTASQMIKKGISQPLYL